MNEGGTEGMESRLHSVYGDQEDSAGDGTAGLNKNVIKITR